MATINLIALMSHRINQLYLLTLEGSIITRVPKLENIFHGQSNLKQMLKVRSSLWHAQNTLVGLELHQQYRG
jgi:hypothetical protein